MKNIYKVIALLLLLLFFHSCKKEDDNSIKDIDGNVYTSIVIGTQTWMIENLKTTHFKNGSEIPLVTNYTSWSSLNAPGFCWYNNDESSNINSYGALYNWFTVNTGNLCPTGWHVPTDADWTTLTDYLGGQSEAGSKLKETGNTHWNSPNTDATNETRFTALPGGYRDINGVFDLIGYRGQWWSATELSSSDAWYRGMLCGYGGVGRYVIEKQIGFSVRCVRD